MYVITYKGKPVTLLKLYKLEKKSLRDWPIANHYIATSFKYESIDLYLHHFGFTWKERTKGIEVEKLV